MYDLILLMAGESQRFSEGNKLFSKVFGKMVFEYALEPFVDDQDLNKIILVTNGESNVKKYQNNPKFLITKGGNNREESVRLGLKLTTAKDVLIHDGARPNLKREDVNKLKEALSKHEVVALVSKTFDSVRENGKLLDRENLFFMKTPQGGRRELFLKAFASPNKNRLDDVEVIKEELGLDFFPVIGLDDNFKITLVSDLERFIKLKTDTIHTGMSFDIHETSNNPPLVLGGVSFPKYNGLIAHSDGDVLFHAVAESLLGCLKKGDLGDNYPSGDIKYKNISSSKFLIDLKEEMKQKEYYILGIDAELMLEEPNLKEHKKTFAQNIAKILEIPETIVNVKATTFEKIGSIGNKKAIGALAITTIGRRR